MVTWSDLFALIVRFCSHQHQHCVHSKFVSACDIRPNCQSLQVFCPLFSSWSAFNMWSSQNSESEPRLLRTADLSNRTCSDIWFCCFFFYISFKVSYWDDDDWTEPSSCSGQNLNVILFVPRIDPPTSPSPAPRCSIKSTLMTNLTIVTDVKSYNLIIQKNKSRIIEGFFRTCGKVCD